MRLKVQIARIYLKSQVVFQSKSEFVNLHSDVCSGTSGSPFAAGRMCSDCNYCYMETLQ